MKVSFILRGKALFIFRASDLRRCEGFFAMPSARQHVRIISQAGKMTFFRNALAIFADSLYNNSIVQMRNLFPEIYLLFIKGLII